MTHARFSSLRSGLLFCANWEVAAALCRSREAGADGGGPDDFESGFVGGRGGAADGELGIGCQLALTAGAMDLAVGRCRRAAVRVTSPAVINGCVEHGYLVFQRQTNETKVIYRRGGNLT
jgi:hypothetical protein